MAVAHGKMSEDEINEVMTAMTDGEVDVLVCTIIIETGSTCSLLARELAFSLRPVSDLMASAEAGTQGPTAAFFRTCRRRFAEGGQESWAESWTAALEQVALPLEEADLRLLQEAGDVLGRYDGESQRQALEGLLRGLEGQAAEAAETARRLCRVYLALGLAAGLFCLILL